MPMRSAGRWFAVLSAQSSPSVRDGAPPTGWQGCSTKRRDPVPSSLRRRTDFRWSAWTTPTTRNWLPATRLPVRPARFRLRVDAAATELHHAKCPPILCGRAFVSGGLSRQLARDDQSLNLVGSLEDLRG